MGVLSAITRVLDRSRRNDLDVLGLQKADRFSDIRLAEVSAG
jgi:hypothetical protein